MLHHLISDVIFERRESVLMTASWVANEAVRRLKDTRRRAAALREGAEAVAREVLASGNPARYCVSRFAEYQFVPLDFLTDGELVDLVARFRAESLACADAAFGLQQRLAARAYLEPEESDGSSCRCGEEKETLQ